MKRIIVQILCLIMAMFLIACGGNESTKDDVDSSTKVEGADTSDKNEESDASKDSTTTDESNTSNDSSGTVELTKTFVDKLAKPEKADISDTGEDYVTYTLDNATFQDVIDYEKILRAEGFYIQLTSNVGDYKAEADHLYAEIKLVFKYTGTEYITSPTEYVKRAEQGLKDPGVFSVTIRMRALGSYNLPELPEGDWRTDDNKKSVIHKLNSYENCSKEERRTLAQNYVELLKEKGYTLDVDEHPDGKDGDYVSGYESLYYFYAKDEAGNCVTVSVGTRDDFDPYNETGIDDWAEVEITLKKIANN